MTIPSRVPVEVEREQPTGLNWRDQIPLRGFWFQAKSPIYGAEPGSGLYS